MIQTNFQNCFPADSIITTFNAVREERIEEVLKDTQYIMKSNFIYHLGILKSALWKPLDLNPDGTLD